MPAEQVSLTYLQNAWIEPDGTVHPVKDWGHEEWAFDNDKDYYQLKVTGWIKLSEDDWISEEVTQAQLDVIYDWHVANNKKFKAEWFKVI